MKYAIIPLIPLLSLALLPAEEVLETGTYKFARTFNLPQKPHVVAYNNGDGPPFIAFSDKESVYTFNPETNEIVAERQAEKKSIAYPFYLDGEVVYDSQDTRFDPRQNSVMLSDSSTADITTLQSFSQIRETGIIVVDQPVKATNIIDPLLKELKCHECLHEQNLPPDQYHLKPLTDRKLIFKEDICSEYVTTISYCPAKQFLAIAYKKKYYFPKGPKSWVRILSIKDNKIKVIQTSELHSPILSLTFNESGDKLLIGLENKELHEYHFGPRGWRSMAGTLGIAAIFIIWYKVFN